MFTTFEILLWPSWANIWNWLRTQRTTQSALVTGVFFCVWYLNQHQWTGSMLPKSLQLPNKLPVIKPLLKLIPILWTWADQFFDIPKMWWRSLWFPVPKEGGSYCVVGHWKGLSQGCQEKLLLTRKGHCLGFPYSQPFVPSWANLCPNPVVSLLFTV